MALRVLDLARRDVDEVVGARGLGAFVGDEAQVAFIVCRFVGCHDEPNELKLAIVIDAVFQPHVCI